ncbi:hypothetical protein TorRG33x02_247990 [Trema orientale]|uniref:Transmembrane protein n=1 Tax=Trema orientale TaxID=63057 RepID=A0A2P5DL45_TREOI|nr:hypothetical protein TorRG33x02_247990 [Trema orientale]
MEAVRNDGGAAKVKPMALWKSDFSMPYVLLRWLGTFAILLSGRTSSVITSIVGWHLGVLHGGHVLVAFNEFTLAIETTYKEFYLHLPEFRIWLSTTMIVGMGFVTSFFPKGITAIVAICYLIGLFGWLIFKHYSMIKSKRENETAASSAS